MNKCSFDELYSGCVEETIPIKDSRKNEGGYRKLRFLAGTGLQEIESFCRNSEIKLSAFFTTAFALTLKSYTIREGACFTCIINGSTVAVYLDCDAKETVLSGIRHCEVFLETVCGADEYSYEYIAGTYNLTGTVCLDLDGKSDTVGAAQLMFRIITDEGLYYECEYDTGAFSEYTVNGLINMFDNITGEFTVRDSLGDVRLITGEDEERILNLYDTSIPYEYKPGYRHLQDAAVRYPDRTAVVAVDRRLTFRELNEEANALGHVLRDHGADVETRIAVLADRNSYAYVMREGVLKSGGAFIPIDPEYPEERITFILEDSNCKLLVTTKEIMDRRKDLIKDLEASGICVIDTAKAVTGGNGNNLNIDVPDDALAYIIYTSGSTGKPKGAMMKNRNLSNLLDDNVHNRLADFYAKRCKVSLAMAAFTFDASILEEFVALGYGNTVVLATMDHIMDPRKMRDLILENQVESLFCTPTYIRNLADIEEFAPAIRCFKSIEIGGEAFYPALYDKLRSINPDLYINNVYGPTETCVICALKELYSSQDITIGFPQNNEKFATVDRDGRLQIPGAVGELVVMGDGVGRGYVGREDLNKRNFITLLGLPAYRSGDLARIREDGDIEFHGRIDNQVKLRGLRIELGEVESVLSNYPGIRSCIVIVAKGETDYLAAYFTADEKIDITSLKAHLSTYLTYYMVPQAFMQLDELPLNANGKIDKKALPEATMMTTETVPPENEDQEWILGAAVEATGNVAIGITTNLFEAGLSSIGCIRLCAMIKEKYGRVIRTSEIFDNNTVKDIEKLVVSKEKEKEYGLLKEYPLSMTQTGIYIECMRYPGSTTYNIPELYKLGAGVDTAKLAKAIEKTVAAHPYLFMEPVRDKDGVVHARRRDEYIFKTPVIKCDKLPAEEELVRPFTFEPGELLFRTEIYETPDGNYFFLDTHHIVSDGGSLEILKRDIYGL